MRLFLSHSHSVWQKSNLLSKKEASVYSTTGWVILSRCFCLSFYVSTGSPFPLYLSLPSTSHSYLFQIKGDLLLFSYSIIFFFCFFVFFYSRITLFSTFFLLFSVLTIVLRTMKVRANAFLFLTPFSKRVNETSSEIEENVRIAAPSLRRSARSAAFTPRGNSSGRVSSNASA